MRMWLTTACVLAGIAAGGCEAPRKESPASQPAIATAPAEAVFKGKTAAQWLDLMRATKNDSPEWSDRAVEVSEAMEMLGAPAVPVLLAGMKDPQWHIREYSCFTIGKLGDAAADGGAVEALVEAMRDKNFLVTESGEAGIGNLGFSSPKARVRMVALLASDDPFIRTRMAVEFGALGYSGREALPALETLLKDPNKEVREAAAEAIESIKSSL